MEENNIIKYYPKINDKRDPKKVNVFVTKEQADILHIPTFEGYPSNIIPAKKRKLTNNKEHFWN